MAIHSSGRTIFSFTRILCNTLGTDEEVDEVAGGASGMSVGGIGEIGDRASEFQLLWYMGQVLQWGGYCVIIVS